MRPQYPRCVPSMRAHNVRPYMIVDSEYAAQGVRKRVDLCGIFRDRKAVRIEAEQAVPGICEAVFVFGDGVYDGSCELLHFRLGASADFFPYV